MAASQIAVEAALTKLTKRFNLSIVNEAASFKKIQTGWQPLPTHHLGG
jgi:hypothetical protein